MTPVRRALVFFGAGLVACLGFAVYSASRGDWAWFAILLVGAVLAIRLLRRGLALDRAGVADGRTLER